VFAVDHLSTAETKCAKWRRESVPVELREKGREALASCLTDLVFGVVVSIAGCFRGRRVNGYTTGSTEFRVNVHGEGRAMRSRLGERNTNLRSAPPSHAATADGCVVKHKIECIGNSDGTFHLEAGTQVRQVEDRTIDRRPAALKGDCGIQGLSPIP
jgi:hypothetical protein